MNVSNNASNDMRAKIALLLLSSNVTVTRVQASSAVLLREKRRTIRDCVETRIYSL